MVQVRMQQYLARRRREQLAGDPLGSLEHRGGERPGPSVLGAVSGERLAPAFEYVRTHPNVRDVIVSGGDPLAMSTERLERICSKIREIPHVDTIRLATRAPVTFPMRVTKELV